MTFGLAGPTPQILKKSKRIYLLWRLGGGKDLGSAVSFDAQASDLQNFGRIVPPYMPMLNNERRCVVD